MTKAEKIAEIKNKYGADNVQAESLIEQDGIFGWYQIPVYEQLAGKGLRRKVKFYVKNEGGAEEAFDDSLKPTDTSLRADPKRVVFRTAVEDAILADGSIRNGTIVSISEEKKFAEVTLYKDSNDDVAKGQYFADKVGENIVFKKLVEV